ncbi:MAG: HSP20 family protein [Pirellulaceae bacterium]|jgi:HSP20 family protein
MFTRLRPASNVQRQFNRLHDQMDRVFGQVRQSAYPPLNVWADSDGFYVEAELPGVDADSLNVTVSDGKNLTISGTRSKPEYGKESYHRRERGFGEFTRTVTLPEHVDNEAVEATYVNGVLTIFLAKREENRPRDVRVNVN